MLHLEDDKTLSTAQKKHINHLAMLHQHPGDRL